MQNAENDKYVAFICTACHQEIEAPEDTAGQQVECPACGARFRKASMVCPHCGIRFTGTRTDESEYDDEVTEETAPETTDTSTEE